MLGVPHRDDARPVYRAAAPKDKLNAVGQGYRIARQERRRLDLGTEPLRNPLDLLERQGVRIGPLEGVGEEGPDGVYFETDELGPCVAVNLARDQWTGFRSAFTAAHEYAHWLLRDLRVEQFELGDRPSDDLAEVRANVFAAAFLMPDEGLEEYFEEAGLLNEEGRIPHLGPADIVRAMDYFGASREAVLYRLQSAKLLDASTAEELRAARFSVTRVAQALEIEFRKSGRFGTRLLALALKAWKRGLISTGRAAELFGLGIEEFRDLMKEIGEDQEIEPGDFELGAAREQ